MRQKAIDIACEVASVIPVLTLTLRSERWQDGVKQGNR